MTDHPSAKRARRAPVRARRRWALCDYTAAIAEASQQGRRPYVSQLLRELRHLVGAA